MTGELASPSGQTATEKKQGGAGWRPLFLLQPYQQLRAGDSIVSGGGAERAARCEYEGWLVERECGAREGHACYRGDRLGPA